MTLGEIYDLAMFYVYGESTPPTTVTTNLQAVGEGIIANIHRKVQEDYNYWFMEAEHGFVVVAGTRAHALPSDFKEERFLTFEHAVTLDNVPPIKKISLEDSVKNYPGATDAAEYPLHYTVWEDEVSLFATPSIDLNLAMFYYKYLARPTVFTSHDDALTQEAPYLIIYMAVAEIETARQNFKQVQVYTQKAILELKNLKHKHWQRKAANYRNLEYYDTR